MSSLENAFESVGYVGFESLNLPETKFDSEVNFKGSEVIIEGHMVSVSEDGTEFALAGEDEDLWIIKKNDVLSSYDLDYSYESVPGYPIRLEIKVGAIVRLERRLIVGKHIIENEEASNNESETSGTKPCNCPRPCGAGNCCAQGGWIYVCRGANCVFSRVRC